MTATGDVLAEQPKVERNHQGRPLIIQPDGSKKPYTRASTFAGTLENTYSLEKWQQRMVILGLIERPDLMLSAAAHWDDRDELDSIAKQAHEAAKASAKAITGTAFHKFIADVNLGKKLGPVPPQYRGHLDNYRAATHGQGMKILAAERFMVCDELGVAGTPDAIVEWLGRRYVIDWKTGQDPKYPGKVCVQLALYAHSQWYDIATGARETPDVDQNNALMLHLDRDSGEVTLYWVNIAAGWEAALLAQKQRAWGSGQKKLIKKIERS